MLGITEIIITDFYFNDKATYDFLKVRLQEMCNTKLEYVMLATSMQQEVSRRMCFYEEDYEVWNECYTLLIPEKMKQEVLFKEKLYDEKTFKELLSTENVFLLNSELCPENSNYKNKMPSIEGLTIKKINNDLYWEVAEQYLINKTIAENNFKKQSIKQKYEIYKKEMQEMEDILQELEK